MKLSNDGPEAWRSSRRACSSSRRMAASFSSLPSFAFSTADFQHARSSCRRPWSAPGRDGGPCRHGRARSGPDRRSGRVRRGSPRPPSPASGPSAAPTPGTSSSSGKSLGPASAAAASVPCRRRMITSSGSDVMMVGQNQVWQHLAGADGASAVAATPPPPAPACRGQARRAGRAGRAARLRRGGRRD